MKTDLTPLTDLEQSIARKFGGASFPPATAAKRFARNIHEGYVKQLSPRGRAFLAYLVHRYRRQYTLTAEESAWVAEWRNWQAPPLEPKRAPQAKPQVVLRVIVDEQACFAFDEVTA